MLSPLALYLLALPVVLGTTESDNQTPPTGMITGTGHIRVLVNTTSHSSSLAAGPPAQAVGCLNAAGRVVLDACAEFTAAQDHVSSPAGVCSFWDTSAAVNSDAVYGASVHAFNCWHHEVVETDTQFYTLSGSPSNFIGQGDFNYYYDLPALPKVSTDEIACWYFVWGSQQKDVPDGHYRAFLQWEPTA